VRLLEPRIVYRPRAGAAPEVERDALAHAYRSIFGCYVKFAQRLSVGSGCLRLLEWEEKVAPAPAPLPSDIPRTGAGDPKEEPAGPKNEREGSKEYGGGKDL